MILSLFLTSPAPLDMPRASAYVVKEDGVTRLEDRYDRTDLWLSQSVIGRWVDDEGRVFVLSSLAYEPPSGTEDSTVTRVDFVSQRRAMPRMRLNGEPPKAFRRAIETVAEVPLCEHRPRTSRQVPHGYRDVMYWQHPTNETDIVCTFRRERSEAWHLAVWHLAKGDDLAERTQLFEDLFLRREAEAAVAVAGGADGATRGKSRRKRVPGERELLRDDARHSVAAYPQWHVADSVEFTVLDDALSRDLVSKVTNEMASVRSRAAVVLPTPIDGSNVLAVARVYASRDEYLDALEIEGNTNMNWSAAYWSPLRRELVAYLPEDEEEEFLKTIRHETFHQYLSYATSMIPTSPWLNEGYAQYFEDPEEDHWDELSGKSEERVEQLAKLLPGLLLLDYGQFYAGTDSERRIKYRLAWSLAVFLEKGADKVRFRPFAKVKGDYFMALFETQDMLKATAAAFPSEDLLRLFVAEWKKFWLGK